MSFASIHAPKIWDRLYNVFVPDIMTQSPDYIKRFGVHVTGDKTIDNRNTYNFTNVKIPVIRIAEYFERGVEVQIPSRDDLIQIHKDIELYLAEWREHMKYDINLSIAENKEMLFSLEKLSKEVYNKAQPREVIDNLFIHKKIGFVVNPLQAAQEERKVVNKPNYDGISQLVRSKTKPQGRFD